MLGASAFVLRKAVAADAALRFTALEPMLRWRLPTADLTERYARVVEIEVGDVLNRLTSGLRLTLSELGVGEHVAHAE